jgi:hypothetical protein
MVVASANLEAVAHVTNPAFKDAQILGGSSYRGNPRNHRSGNPCRGTTTGESQWTKQPHQWQMK